ncbi:hypothetical protein HID58_068378 [Brassica napus]|uniref:Uncharacterized protein n=1 Tax=Brassica napus TaxID=3708 RepID=A0ABQ7ZL50_BRANA|nr:hypothetical protein HID58_068378 [Brassica napus]
MEKGLQMWFGTALTWLPPPLRRRNNTIEILVRRSSFNRSPRSPPTLNHFKP